MPAARPLRINKRPNAWMKPIPAIAWLTTSAIMAAPHDLLDLPQAVGGRKAFAALDWASRAAAELVQVAAIANLAST
jgi:hypothetical protein